MNAWENFRVALEALATNKLRSFLTVLGIIIGVGAVIGIVSFVQGLQHLVQTEIEGVGATYILVVPNFSNDPSQAERNGQIELKWQDGLDLQRRVPGISGVSPLHQTRDLVADQGKSRTSAVMAVAADYQEINNHYVDRGRFLTPLDLDAGKRIAVIGRKVAEELGLADDPLKRSIRIRGVAFTVVGVMEEKGQALGQDNDDVVIIPYTTSTSLWGEPRAVMLTVRAREPKEVDRVKDGIEEFLHQRYPPKEGEPERHEVILQAEMLASVNKIFGSFTAVMGGVVGFSLLVGGIGIMNIMLVSVTERTREIGIRKAMGATPRQITLQFLIEAVTLSVAGGLVGIGFGWLLGTLGSIAMSRFLVPDFPTAVVPAWAFLLSFTFCSVIGVGFGLYPAWKAGRMDPIDALRYE